MWLFDKDDFVRTMTKVFASEHAFNDPGVRSKLKKRRCGAGTAGRHPRAGNRRAPTRHASSKCSMSQERRSRTASSRADARIGRVAESAHRRTRHGDRTSRAAARPPSPTAAARPADLHARADAANLHAATAASEPAPQPYTPAGYGTLLRPSSGHPLPQQPPLPPPRTTPDDDPFGGTGDFTPIT